MPGLRLLGMLVVLLAIAASAGPARPAPSYVSTNWTTADGLPVISLTGMVQTPDGYLWISTTDGLVRFDGTRFTIFRAGSTPELATDRFARLHVESDGSLWIVTQGFGFLRFFEGRFTRYLLPTQRTTRVDLGFARDASNVLWVGHDDGISRFVDGDFVPLWRSPEGAVVRNIARDPEGRMWWHTDDTLYSTDEDGVREMGTAPPGGPLIGMVIGPDDAPWLSTLEGVVAWRSGLVDTTPPDAIPPFGRPLVDGEALWISAGNGIFRYEAGSWEHVHETGMAWPSLFREGENLWYAADGMLHVDEDPLSGQPAEPMSFLRDHEGNVWVATLRHGLFRYSPSFFTVISEDEGLPYQSVYALFEVNPGEVLVGTLLGLARIRGDRVTNLESVSGWIATIHRTRSGELLIGMGQPSGLSRLAEDDTLIPVPGFPEKTLVFVIHEDRDGNLWVGERDALYRRTGGVWTRFGPEDGLPDAYVRSIRETDHGLWMGSNGGGLVHYDGRTFSVIDTSSGLSGMNVRGVYEDHEGILWVGTEGFGLNRLEVDAGGNPRITVIQEKDGLYDDVVHDCIEDDSGRLWMSSNRGIFWIRRSGLEAFARGERSRVVSTAYTESHGLRNREANGGTQPVILRDSERRLWFATVDGVAIVDPSTVPLEEPPPSVHIEEVLAGRDRFAAIAGEATLPRGRRTFEIPYSAIALRAPENVTFRYRLEDVDGEWTEVGQRRTAYFTHVPPGAHRFEVVASRGGIAWGEPASLLVRIPHEFHETAWFRGLVILGILGALVLLYRYRTRIQRERLEAVTAEVENRRRVEHALHRLGQRLIDAQEDERKRLSRELHDDLSQRLALLNIEISMLGQRSGQDVASLEDLARDLAGDLRRISHNLHPGKLEQVGIVTALAGLCRETPARPSTEIRFRNEAGEIDPPFEIGLCLYRVAQEGLRNAWKHSGADRIDLVLGRDASGITLEVADTGRGFAGTASSEAGLGIMSMTERARAVGGSLRLESRPGGGTRLRLHVPLDEVQSPA